VQSGNANHSINLTRAIARVDVGVGEISGEESDFAWSGLDAEDAEIPFELGHVYVMRPSNTYGVMPYPSAAAGAPSIPTGNTLFSLAQSTTTFNYAATASSTGGHITQEIYTPESNVLVTTTGVAGDANHVNRTAIVVGGYYDGSATETFYRLDFSVDEKLVNILRNHLYLFSISSVSGPGYSDPGTAYENQSMNMTVNIYDWTETDMKEIFLDGTNYVKLGASGNYDGDERESLVYRGIGSQDAIEIDTNIPLDQFTLTLDNGGALPDEEDPSVIENERFRAELVTGDDGKTYFVFTALAEYDPAATDNPSLLTIANGRIKFEITIRQAETDPADWGDGGGIDFSYDE
jgi:hypothetical protein